MLFSKNKFKKALTAFISASLLIPTVSSCVVNSDEEKTQTSFDENNIALRFGVLSDIHLSGSWNKAGHKYLDNAYKALLSLSGRNNDGSTRLDAVFIDGDITDAMNSSGNISSDMHKLYQNYTEIAAFRDISLDNFNAEDKTENVSVIFAYGNHDSTNGIALDESKQTDTTGFYSAKLFEKILSGYTWKDSVPENASATGNEIAQYNKQLISEYDEEGGENYAYFFGKDTTTGEYGREYGNRHIVVNGYHFITVEPETYTSTYAVETVQWLDGLLAEITNEEPDKAVFIATHPRIENTIFKATESSQDLTPVLNKYPQVIIWGGHDHTPLNRELAIWQGGKGTFTAVDTGVVQYGSGKSFSFKGNKNPENALNFGGYSGSEYRRMSQGELVEVDADGNVRINRLDFYNSDIANGEVKMIGEPWIIENISSDGSHLEKFTVAARSAANTAPYFDSTAKLSAEVNESSINISFPAAKDNERIISYFVDVKDKNGVNLGSHELTSYYYDYADAKELESKTYTFEIKDEIPVNEDVTISVYAADDYGAQSAKLAATVMRVVETEAAYPVKKFNLANLNKNNWSGSCEGTLTHGVAFEGRTASEIKKAAKNTKNAIIMNNWSTPLTGLDTHSYFVVDYYYKHDVNSEKAAAKEMRWRFYTGGGTVTHKNPLETNKWASIVIPLENSIEKFAKDSYQMKQYKFDPFGETAVSALDDNDTMYISAIRLVHGNPTVFTENGTAYVSADSYIGGTAVDVYAKIADAIASLGEEGGTVYIEGDIIAELGTDIEATESARKPVTVMGFGKTLAEQQKNRLWFKKTDAGRTAKYNGDITYDKITIKAPIDEAGLFSYGHKVTIGKDILTEKTVKGKEDIDASGTKSMAFNLGTYYNIQGDSKFDIYGGNFTDIATVYAWMNTTSPPTTKINATYNFFGGTFDRVTSGPRNSSTTVIITEGDVDYSFYGGTFENVFTGLYKYGTVKGDVRYDVYGGKFENGILFSNFSNPAGLVHMGNVAVVINSKGKDGYSITDTVTLKSAEENLYFKTSDDKKSVAIINNAELEKAQFDTSLVADYKVKVYGGSVQPVFENGILKGFTAASDIDGLYPFCGNDRIYAENGIYTIPEGETEIRFGLSPTIEYSENMTEAELSGAFVVLGAQFRKDNVALRFVASIGSDIIASLEEMNADNTACAAGKITGYGFVVVPADYLAQGVQPEIGMENVYVVPAVKKFDTTKENRLLYTVAIVDITVNNYGRNYTARPYITYDDGFGNICTFYGEAYSSSLVAVANAALSNENDKAAAQSIIDSYNSHKG